MTVGSLLGCFNLPVSIQTNEGLNWSDDGKLAIATKKGVYVFEITPNARGPGGPKARNTKTTINFVKTFVEADVSESPWQLDNVLSEEDLAGLPRSLRTEVVLDRLVCPHLPAQGDNTDLATFRQHCKVEQPASAEILIGRPAWEESIMVYGWDYGVVLVIKTQPNGPY